MLDAVSTASANQNGSEATDSPCHLPFLSRSIDRFAPVLIRPAHTRYPDESGH